MKILLTCIRILIISILLLTVHFFIHSVLPFPFHLINFLFAILVCLLWFKNVAFALWYLVPLSFVLELFSLEPYGITTLTLLGGILVTHWLLKRIFTVHSVFIVFLATTLGMLCLRASTLLINVLANRIFSYALPAWSDHLVLTYLTELFLTACFTSLLYIAISLSLKKINPGFVDSGTHHSLVLR